jgi:hypothetical protein
MEWGSFMACYPVYLRSFMADGIHLKKFEIIRKDDGDIFDIINY